MLTPAAIFFNFCCRHEKLVDAKSDMVREGVERLQELGKWLAGVCRGAKEVWGQGKVVRVRPKNSSCIPFFRKEVEYTQILREKIKELLRKKPFENKEYFQTSGMNYPMSRITISLKTLLLLGFFFYSSESPKVHLNI